MHLRSSCHCAGTVASSPHLTPASHLLILHLLLPLALRTNFDQVVCGPALGDKTMQCPEIDLDTQCRYRIDVDTEYTRAPDNEYTNPCGGAQPSVLSGSVARLQSSAEDRHQWLAAASSALPRPLLPSTHLQTRQ